MVNKFALLLVAVLAGCNAFPTPEEEQDMSIFFEHVDPDARIVGGTTAVNGAHPHIGALTHGATVRTFLCGSSVLTRRTILTAAHCIRPLVSGNLLNPSLRVTVGTNRWNLGGQMYAFQRFVIHPEYNANLIKSDLSILHTSAIIAMGTMVRPISINWDWVGPRVNCRVAGWGRIRAGGALSANLLQLNVVTVDGRDCTRDVPIVAAQNNMNAPPVLPPIEICTFHSRNHGTCNGDSGGPLMRIDRGQLIGVVSWGLPCALGAPDMFVRLSAYRAWVQANTLN